MKEELKKLLDANFIYPISDSKWVYPLVVFPKTNGKWQICVDYRELNKVTQKYHFPFHLSTKSLIYSQERNSSLSWMASVATTKFPLKTRIKLLSPTLGEHSLTGYFLSDRAMHLLHFKEPYSIFL